MRWIHPGEGTIYPSEFIPLFEKNGKICELDLYMFEEVCRLTDSWIKENKTVSQISVNISRFHLREAGSEIWKEYKSILDRYDITLKMDRSFFINENDKSRKIVGSIIQLAHSLNMDVVAEGIEEKEQVEMLWKMGCDLIQGYVYSRPLPVDEFEQWRQEHER